MYDRSVTTSAALCKSSNACRPLAIIESKSAFVTTDQYTNVHRYVVIEVRKGTQDGLQITHKRLWGCCDGQCSLWERVRHRSVSTIRAAQLRDSTACKTIVFTSNKVLTRNVMLNRIIMHTYLLLEHNMHVDSTEQ